MFAGSASGGKVNATDSFNAGGETYLKMNFEAGFEAPEIIMDGLGEPAMDGQTVVLRFTCVASNSAGDSGSATPVVVNMIM